MTKAPHRQHIYKKKHSISQSLSKERRFWIYGFHAVVAALNNPSRKKYRLIATKNAATRLNKEIKQTAISIEYADAKKFPVALTRNTVHQGVALQVDFLECPKLKNLCETFSATARIVILDRVSDPYNIGAVMRSALAFGAEAVIAPTRHSPPETGALAKSASGSLETIPYVRVSNLSVAMSELRKNKFTLIGLDSTAPMISVKDLNELNEDRVGFVLGSESVGMRHLTQQNCDRIFKLCDDSLNISNAASVALFAVQQKKFMPLFPQKNIFLS